MHRDLVYPSEHDPQGDRYRDIVVDNDKAANPRHQLDSKVPANQLGSSQGSSPTASRRLRTDEGRELVAQQVNILVEALG